MIISLEVVPAKMWDTKSCRGTSHSQEEMSATPDEQEQSASQVDKRF
jgi:hypothetical protein